MSTLLCKYVMALREIFYHFQLFKQDIGVTVMMSALNMVLQYFLQVPHSG